MRCPAVARWIHNTRASRGVVREKERMGEIRVIENS